jgi:hypothetical protein
MDAVMGSDSADLPAAHSDDELPRASEYPEPSALDLARVQKMSPPQHDDYTTADVPALLHRLYALASQI